MIGPCASLPRNVAREVFPERAVRAERISSFDIAITWVTLEAVASCVTPARPSLYCREAAAVAFLCERCPARPHAIAGSSIALCVSHDETTPGINPARP